MKKKYVIALVLSVLLCLASFGADVNVPTFEVITRGFMDSGSFVLSTRGSVDFLFAGGYKFNGRVLLGFESNDLEDLTQSKSMEFKGAEITMRELLGLPLHLTYFTGINDTFISGDIFPSMFGSKPISTKFRGYLYFPDPLQIRYDGIHTVSGTGVKLSTTFGTERNQTELYLYQDSYLGTGNYSLDIRTLLNFQKFKLEYFLGVSYPASPPFGFYRTGLLLFYDTGAGGEFLTQLGIPRYNPATDSIAIDLFYFLFEPRVRFGIFSIILTLFWHPQYYLQEVTNELGSADINVNFQFGEPELSPTSGGIESALNFSTTGGQQFKAVISPYLSAITSGVIWNVKINAKIFPLSVADLFDVFIGVRAEF